MPEISRFYGIIVKMVLMIMTNTINRMFMCITVNTKRLSGLMEKCLKENFR